MGDYSFLGFSEPFSSISHFLGAIVCLFYFRPLWRTARGHLGHRIAVAIFCGATVLLLLLSGLFHLLPNGTSAKILFQRLDHAAIFILIAGTFTPLHSILFRGRLRWIPLVVIWTIAIAGIVLKEVFFSQIPELLSVSIYIGMGWLGIFSAFFIYLHWGFNLVVPLLKGALAYSLGSIIDLLHKPILLPGIFGPHELFHIAVLIGVTYHWKFIHEVALSASLPIEK